MTGDLGPPGRERPGPTPETGPIQKSADTTTDKTKITAQPRYFHAGGLRRREAALRLPPIGRCGCIRDPDLDKHRCGARPLTDHQFDGWRATAEHILEGDMCRSSRSRRCGLCGGVVAATANSHNSCGSWSDEHHPKCHG